MNKNNLVEGEIYLYTHSGKPYSQFKYAGISLKKEHPHLFRPFPTPNPHHYLALENGGILLTDEEVSLYIKQK